RDETSFPVDTPRADRTDDGGRNVERADLLGLEGADERVEAVRIELRVVLVERVVEEGVEHDAVDATPLALDRAAGPVEKLVHLVAPVAFPRGALDREPALVLTMGLKPRGGKAARRGDESIGPQAPPPGRLPASSSVAPAGAAPAAPIRLERL